MILTYFPSASGLPIVGNVVNTVGDFFHGVGQGAQAVDNAIEGGLEWQDTLQTHEPVTFTGNQLLQSAQGGLATLDDYIQKLSPYLVN